MTRHGRGDKSDGTAAVTAGTAPANVEATAASMNEAMAAKRERKQVSAFTCALMAQRAEMCAHGRAGVGAPSLASSLLPLGKVLRARF